MRQELVRLVLNPSVCRCGSPSRKRGTELSPLVGLVPGDRCCGPVCGEAFDSLVLSLWPLSEGGMVVPELKCSFRHCFEPNQAMISAEARTG